ncbi:MAG: NUDIX hydrolase [Xanthomonadales bacterium]|nr:NUDIX hydrolase [Xanthomonadales bacterium]
MTKHTANDEAPPLLSTRSLHEGRFLALRQRGRWEFVERVNAYGAAVVIAVTDADELVLVEQFREPLQGNCIENPAGLAGDQPGEEDILSAARRELLEETGFQAAQVELLMTGPSAPGMASELLSFVRATGLRRVHAGGGDGGENITVHVIPMAQVAPFLARQLRYGVHVDPRVYAALFFARYHIDGRALASDQPPFS